MKRSVIFVLSLIASAAYADSISVGCSVMTYGCINLPNQSKQCGWGYDVGKVNSIGLKKTGSGPDYEIWQGSLNGSIINKYAYNVMIYQRRERTQSFNYLTINMDVDNGIVISASGQSTTDLKYLSKTSDQGVGLHCTTELTQPSRSSR
jgi:hypothetical protein